jgi:4-hydroxybenzoate polyprenyltransferase
MFYATAAYLGQPLHTLWASLLILMIALVPGAVYVSVINDATDREDDRAAGKPVRAVAPLTLVLTIGACAGAGLAVGFNWRDDLALVAAYGAAWLAFSLYSLPPFRFKTRGALGIVCDAAGSLMCPSLVAVLLVYRDSGTSSREPVWLIAVGVWALAYGLRGILWHQLSDTAADRRAGVRTFVQAQGLTRARRVGTWVVFPVEVLALVVILAHLPPMWPILALVAYGAFAWAQVRRWQMSPIIVAPAPRYFIVLLDYYDVFLPLALLGMAAAAHPADLLVLLAHCLIFPIRIGVTLKSAWRLARATAGAWKGAAARRWPFRRVS